MNRFLQIILPRFTREECKKNSFSIDTVKPLEGPQRVFTRNFELGDEVYFLGHDGVGGFWHGDIITADEELVRKKHNLQFYKMIGRLKRKKYICV